MQLQSDRTCDQSKNNSQQDIEELKKNIALTNGQLHEMISDHDRFSERIRQLNRKSIIEINDEMYEQAIVYLSEAEKNLEYAASCGLSLDRSLIIATLKNQACAYQRLWDLQVCYDYMEALIYNMSVSVVEGQNLSMTEQVKIPNSEESRRVNKLFNYRLQMALNYLQYSALSSQIGKHLGAKKYAQKSLEYFKILIKQCILYDRKLNDKNSLILQQLHQNIDFNGEENFQRVLNESKIAIQKVKNNRYFFTFNTKIIQKLTMGDIMQINPMFPEKSKTDIQNQWFISQLGLTYITIYVSCCFFAIATEIRLSIQKKLFSNQKQYQIQDAKLFHLHAIRLASEISLIESNFLTHIIKSLKNNFLIDIFQKNINCNEYELQQISEIKHKQKPNTTNQEPEESPLQKSTLQKKDRHTTHNHHHSGPNFLEKVPRKTSQNRNIQSPSSKKFIKKTPVKESENKSNSKKDIKVIKIKSKSKGKIDGRDREEKREVIQDYFGIGKERKGDRKMQKQAKNSSKSKLSKRNSYKQLPFSKSKQKQITKQKIQHIN